MFLSVPLPQLTDQQVAGRLNSGVRPQDKVPRAPMNQAVTNEIVRLGGDPTDEIWLWLVTRGPHGSSFTWGQTRNEPHGYVGVTHRQEITAQLAESIPAFEQRARQVVGAAMQSELSELARRAIQVAAVVGGSAELQMVKQLADSQDPAVASDARACAFYLKGRT